MANILCIAIIGPEATGKTTLADKLYRHFQGYDFASMKTEEYARRYFEERKLPADHRLNVKEMREVMQGQRAAEDAAAAGIQSERGVIWIDAGTVHGPLYAGMKYKADNGLSKSIKDLEKPTSKAKGEAGSLGHSPNDDTTLYFDLYGTDKEVMDYARKAGYDAFLLCMPHKSLGWKEDGVRSMPKLADRRRFADACGAFVERYYPHAPLVSVDAGSWKEREKQAIKIIDEWLNLTRLYT
jgi:nicotinamide riboside kinase